MYIDLRVKYPLILSNFNQNFNFPDIFSKNTKMSNFMKIQHVRTGRRSDGRTDRHDEANSLFFLAISRTRL
jgi:hypothetical protein